MNSTSNGILSNVILSLLLFVMLLQIGCAVPFISSRYGEMKIQGTEIKGKISELRSKKLWGAEYEKECYKSNIDKICENLEIALFQKNEEDIFLAQTKFDSEGNFYMAIPEFQMQSWCERHYIWVREYGKHYNDDYNRECYVAPAVFCLVVNGLEKIYMLIQGKLILQLAGVNPRTILSVFYLGMRLKVHCLLLLIRYVH